MAWQQVIVHQWQKRHWMWLLWPVSVCYAGCMTLRNWLYDHGLLKTIELPVPIWVIGNITVGGTGKTALVIHLANLLKEQGLQVGIISRGYGGRKQHAPMLLDGSEDPKTVGDEALLIHHKTHAPVVVCRDRVKAAQTLLEHHRVDLIISDDGLQHRRLGRDWEVVIHDTHCNQGNGWCLPAGPLREPIQRLATVGCVIAHTEQTQQADWMRRLPPRLYPLHEPMATQPIDALKDTPMHLVTAIGNPDRLMANLQAWGLNITSHTLYNDHYLYKIEDFKAIPADSTIVTTEKDAIKIMKLNIKNKVVVLEEIIELSAPLIAHFLGKCATLKVHLR